MTLGWLPSPVSARCVSPTCQALARPGAAAIGVALEHPWLRRLRQRGFCAPVALLVLAACLIALTGCDLRSTALDGIRARNELRVVTLNAPTCFYFGAQGTEGLEYRLASAFAADLGVRLVMYPVSDERAMQREVESGRADIAAAQLTATRRWTQVGKAAKPYDRIEQYLVYRRDHAKPRTTAQIETGTVAVRSGSPQEQDLEALPNSTRPRSWIVATATDADPLAEVSSGRALYALVDAREYSFARHLHPDVAVGFALTGARPVQWMVRRKAHDLVDAVNRFFDGLRHTGQLVKVLQEDTGDLRPLEYVESRQFQTNLTERLPRFQPWFQQAAAATGIDWHLLAAIAYQESRWDPAAQSGDGALGLMMLTEGTAASMGAPNRNDPAQNIVAGARYFEQVRAKIPVRVPEPDRTWLALAAYNVGYGHLEDARVLTQARGGNPDSWPAVRETLPLLAEERWYERAKRGYARGWEPVQFVERVQRFLTLLAWQPGDGVAVPPAGPPEPSVGDASEPAAPGPEPATVPLS